MLDEDTFVREIKPEFRAPYLREVRRIIREKKRTFKTEANNIRDTFRQEIEISQAHDDIVNLCIHPFVEESMPTRKHGYSFEVADPLYEVGKPPNFDFLIVNRGAKTPIAIFGEAKSQMTISNISRELADIEQKIQVVEFRLEYIKEHYLKLRTDPIREYVLAVRPELVNDVGYHIEKSKRKIILWQADVYNFKLSLARPRDEGMFQGRTHSDASLNRELGSNGVRSTLNVYPVFPQSHMFTKLTLLIQSRNLSENSHLVLTQLLRQKVDTYLPRLEEEQKKELIQSIINEGLKLRFIEQDKELKGAFKIKSRSRTEDSLGPELRKLWIESKLEEKKDKEINDEILTLRKRILDQQVGTPTLMGSVGMPEPPFTEKVKRTRKRS